MRFKFEKLIIWQKAMELGEYLNVLADKFSKKEVYNLSSQIRRAIDSIALNTCRTGWPTRQVSKGSIGQSNPEYKKFMGYSIRSLAEVVTCLHKANRRAYITELEFINYYNFSFNEYDGCVQK